jgi:hypothetical protein
MRASQVRIRIFVAAALALTAAAAIASPPARTELRIEVRQPDGARAILARHLDLHEEPAYGVSAASDMRPEALGAPLPPQPPAAADYPPGATQLEFVQKRGVWVRTTTYTRRDDGAWQLASDQLDNPRDKATLSKPLVGPIRPVE